MNDDRRTHIFQTQGPVRLRVEMPRGRIELVASPSETTTVELYAPNGDAAARDWIADAEVMQIDGEIVVRGRRREPNWLSWIAPMGLMGQIEATVRAPEGSAAHLAVGAGRIETTGKLGKVSGWTGAGAIRLSECEEARVHTGSGAIDIASASGSVDAKTGAGKVSVGKVGADARIVTGAGAARLGEAIGKANLSTGHGNVEIERAGDSVEVFTASGNIQVGRADHGRVKAKTVSGQVSVGVAQGVAALLDVSTLSGRVRSELEAAAAPADDEKRVELVLSTVSGNVRVARA